MKKWLVCLGYALALALLSSMLPRLMELPFLSLFTAEHQIGKGFELNDAFYQFNSTPSSPRAFDVVVVNTEGFGQGVSPEFRNRLKDLLSSCLELGPSAIGVDFIFEEQPGQGEMMELLTALLRKQLIEDDRIVIAHKLGKPNSITSEADRLGVVNFPETGRTTIRNQQLSFFENGQQLPTFSAKLVEIHQPGRMASQDVPEVFPLHYLRNGETHERIFLSDSSDLAFRRTIGIPILDANEVLAHPHRFREWIRKKVIIVGHVSQNPFDIEDKHRVPNDPVFFNRIPTFSGPLIHALAVDNLLNFEDRGWRYVPNGLRSAAAMVLLVILIYLVLYTRLGKTMNFAFLGLLTLPVIYFGYVLMNFGWYWPMNTTLLSFVFIEEIMEVIHPAMRRVLKRIRGWRKRISFLAALVIAFYGAMGSASGQNVELMVMQGQAMHRGEAHTVEEFAIFNLYPGEVMEFSGEGKALITVDDVSAIWHGTGQHSHQNLVDFVRGGAPSLTSEILRVLFIEGIQIDDNKPNVGAATRGGGGLELSDLDERVVWEDSVWLGLLEATPSAPPISWTLIDGDWNERSGESIEGGEWVDLLPGEEYVYSLLTYGAEVGSGEFRCASAIEHQSVETAVNYVMNKCKGCDPTVRDSVERMIRLEIPYH